MSFPVNELIYNTARHGFVDRRASDLAGAIAYFEGGQGEPGYEEAKQWLDAIINDTEPLVKPEQAFVVTQILEAIYISHETGKEVILR